MKAAVGSAVSNSMKVMRFGGNMREAATTEGGKVEVQAKLGWQVNTWTVGENGNGCSLFMEDNTYNLEPGKEYSMGAYMLEVCPCCTAGKPRIKTHHLSVGINEKGPARLVLEGKEGCHRGIPIGMGGRLRLICQDIHCVRLNLPVARVMWQAEPSLTAGVESLEQDPFLSDLAWKLK